MIVDDALLSKLEKLSSLEIKEEQRHEIKSQIENIITFLKVTRTRTKEKNM